MIRIRSCFVADGVLVDRETGQVSVFGLREHVRAESYPFTVHKLDFFCLMEREEGDPEKCVGGFTIALGGEELARSQVDVDFLGFRRSRTTLHVSGLVIPRAGSVLFRFVLPGHDSVEQVVIAEAVGSPARSSGAMTYRIGSSSVTIGNGDIRFR